MCLGGDDNLCAQYRLLGQGRDGGMAELVTVPAANVFAKPANLSFEEAASIPLVFTTALHMILTRAHLQYGETVLVNAAGSGVGVAAIQVAKLHGSHVIASAGSDEKLVKARELGARWQNSELLLITLGATIGIPPQVLVALLAGVIGIRFRTFVAIDVAGRIARFTTIVLIAHLV